MVMSPVGLGTKNYCAGEGQQQFTSQSVIKVLIRAGLTGLPAKPEDAGCVTVSSVIQQTFAGETRYLRLDGSVVMTGLLPVSE
jgi:hypothetical protein